MKVVVAATVEQKQHIVELVNEFYTTVLPIYFSDDKITQFRNMNVLNPSIEDQMYNETLRDAFRIISSLQVMNSLLGNVNNCDEVEYERIFNRNSKILNEYGYFFPLSFEQFLEAETNYPNLSQYTQSTNNWIM